MLIKEQTVCFTGHRPEKLPGNGNERNSFTVMLKSMLHYRIYAAAQAGYKYFITGLARGVDLWAAESIIDIKSEFPQIELISAKPFPEHGNQFKGKDLWSLNSVLEKSNDIVCVSDRYFPGCYSLRNKFMVNNSSYLIGVVDKYSSGTGQTISYAKKNGLKISLIKVSDVLKTTDHSEKNSNLFLD